MYPISFDRVDQGPLNDNKFNTSALHLRIYCPKFPKNVKQNLSFFSSHLSREQFEQTCRLVLEDCIEAIWSNVTAEQRHDQFVEIGKALSQWLHCRCGNDGSLFLIRLIIKIYISILTLCQIL